MTVMWLWWAWCRYDNYCPNESEFHMSAIGTICTIVHDSEYGVVTYENDMT